MTANGPIPDPASGRRQPSTDTPSPATFDRQRTPPTVSDRWCLAALLTFTLIVRGTVLWLLRDNLNQDPDAYREIAEFLIQRGEYALGKLSPLEGASRPMATAYRPPLYPIVLSNLPTSDGGQLSLAKVAGLHLLLGVGTVWLTWLTVRRVDCSHHLAGAVNTAQPRIPLVAALVACDPLLLNQQTLVMTETLAAFLTILSLWCLAKFDSDRSTFNAAMAGGAIGLAVLCRPTFLPWLGLVAAGLIAVRGGKKPLHTTTEKYNIVDDFGWRVANLAAFSLIAAGVISPWAIRNYREFGKPLVTTTHGGFTLYLGNNDLFYDWLEHDRTGVPWNSQILQNRLWGQWRTTTAAYNRQEFALDELCYKRAKQEIQRRPKMFFRACVYRVCQIWSPLPHKLTANESASRRLLRYATCAWYCGVFALAAAGIWQRRWQILQPPWVWGLLLCLVFTAVHTFYWTNMRMRAPLMPFIALVAGAALSKRKN